MKISLSSYLLDDVLSRALPFLLLITIVSSQNTDKKICQTKECLASAENFKESMDTNINPCDNFYLYACGNNKTSTLSPRSTFGLRNHENEKEITDFLKQNNTSEEPEAVHKARKLFSLCMNKASYSNTLQHIEVMLQNIGLPVQSFLSGENKNFDYATALAKAIRLAGIKIYFDLGVRANPYNRTMNMITLRKPTLDLDPNMMPLVRILTASDTEASSKTISENEFFVRVTNLMCKGNTSLPCIQWTSNTNDSYQKEVMVEKLLKRISELNRVNNIARSTINSSSPVAVIYTLKQLQNLNDAIASEVNTKIPKLNWTRYIEEIFTGLNNVTLDLSNPSKVQINIEQLEFVKDMLKFIHNSDNIKEIELEIWWRVVFILVSYVDSNMFEAKNSIWGVGVDRMRERRCAELSTRSFSMAVSYVYATNDKYIKAKQQIRKMFENIRESFKQIIQQVPWMDETTRQKALTKLQLMRSNIAFPSVDKTTPLLNEFYRDIQVTNNFYETMISKIQHQTAKKLNTLNQINDLFDDDWIINPTIVNGYYDCNTNIMTITASMLGGSIYSNSLRALDYGAIGSIIGHEIAHGFDNLGRRYNEIGNIEDWWKPETLNLFKEKAKCFRNAYSNYSITRDNITEKANSAATLPEDISDNAGFKGTLFAYRRFVSQFGVEPLLPQFENFTHEQLFTLSFANMWCKTPTKSFEDESPFLDHSPNGVRVNGVLRNSKEFTEIWNCSKGSNMNPNVDKCSVW